MMVMMMWTFTGLGKILDQTSVTQESTLL